MLVIINKHFIFKAATIFFMISELFLSYGISASTKNENTKQYDSKVFAYKVIDAPKSTWNISVYNPIYDDKQFEALFGHKASFKFTDHQVLLIYVSPKDYCHLEVVSAKPVIRNNERKLSIVLNLIPKKDEKKIPLNKRVQSASIIFCISGKQYLNYEFLDLIGKEIPFQSVNEIDEARAKISPLFPSTVIPGTPMF